MLNTPFDLPLKCDPLKFHSILQSKMLSPHLSFWCLWSTKILSAQLIYSTSPTIKKAYVSIALTTNKIKMAHFYTVVQTLTQMCVQQQWCYLECCCPCVLSADGVSIIGPHDLINPVAFERQGLLWRHHTQFLQLQEEIKTFLSIGVLLKLWVMSLFQFTLHQWKSSTEMFSNPRWIWWSCWISRKLKRLWVCCVGAHWRSVRSLLLSAEWIWKVYH